MKMTNDNQQDRRLRSSSRRQDKLNGTNLFAPGALKRKKLPLPVVLALGAGAITYLSGCDITVRQPGVVVTAPTVAVEAPVVAVDAPPVVLEEGVAVGGVAWVEPPLGVDYVLLGGRYAYFNPGLGCWYYRPVGWSVPLGVHVREVRDFGELDRIHRSDVRRGPGGRPEVRRGGAGGRPDVRGGAGGRPDRVMLALAWWKRA